MMAGPIRSADILKPTGRAAHSTAANVGTTTVAAGTGAWVATQTGEPMAGMAVTVALKALGKVARDQLSDPLLPGWQKAIWTVVSFLG